MRNAKVHLRNIKTHLWYVKNLRNTPMYSAQFLVDWAFFALNQIKNAPLFLAKLAMVTYHERLPSTKVAQEYPNH